MASDQAQASICYIQGVDNKAAGKMVNTIFLLEEDYPYNLEEARKFGELNPRDETKKVKTSNDLTPVILDESKPDQIVKIGAQLSLAIKT